MIIILKRKNIILFFTILTMAALLFKVISDNINIVEYTPPVPVINQQKVDSGEEYHRPSKDLPLPNPYTLQTFIQNENAGDFYNPEEVIYAYYGILKEASNMQGHSGGCGSIGDGKMPYPYAYSLLTEEVRKKISLPEFIDSFEGIGHITLLKLYSLPIPEDTSKDLKYYMVELELISGPKMEDLIKEQEYEYKEELSYFLYYYGVVTVKEEAGLKNNWKIQKIDYFPEEFLCAPYHSWFYDSAAIIQIVYMDNLKLISEIYDIIEKDGLVLIYGRGGGEQYRFDFVRLTNGHDILINESILKDEKWVSVNLLTEDWEDIRLSIMEGNLFPSPTEKLRSSLRS